MESELCPHCRAIKELLNFANQQLQASETADDFDWWMRMNDVIYSVYMHCEGDSCRTWDALVKGLPPSDGDERTSSVCDKVYELDAWVRRELQNYVERN